MEADQGFAVPQIPAAPVPGLGKGVRGPEGAGGRVPLRHPPQWQPISSCFPAVVSTCPQTGSLPAISDLQMEISPGGVRASHSITHFGLGVLAAKKHPDKDTHTSDSTPNTSYNQALF